MLLIWAFAAERWFVTWLQGPCPPTVAGHAASTSLTVGGQGPVETVGPQGANTA
ncbi:hypothetical protein FHY18_000241 [Xanthomonas arboricola]|nr:hypothetical protein [Xanthomonas sp. 3793]